MISNPFDLPFTKSWLSFQRSKNVHTPSSDFFVWVEQEFGELVSSFPHAFKDVTMGGVEAGLGHVELLSGGVLWVPTSFVIPSTFFSTTQTWKLVHIENPTSNKSFKACYKICDGTWNWISINCFLLGKSNRPFMVLSWLGGIN